MIVPQLDVHGHRFLSSHCSTSCTDLQEELLKIIAFGVFMEYYSVYGEAGTSGSTGIDALRELSRRIAWAPRAALVLSEDLKRNLAVSCGNANPDQAT